MSLEDNFEMYFYFWIISWELLKEMKTLHPGQTQAGKALWGGEIYRQYLGKDLRSVLKALFYWQSRQLQLSCSHVHNPITTPEPHPAPLGAAGPCCWHRWGCCNHTAQATACDGGFLLEMVFGPQKPSPSSPLSPTYHPFDYFLKQNSNFIASK